LTRIAGFWFLLTSLDNVVGRYVGKAREAAHRSRLHGDPHVDQVLGEGDRLGVARDADRPVQVGRRVPVLAVRDPDHCPRQLSDLGHFGSPLADDAADELVGDGHLVGLLAVRRSPLSAQHGKGCRIEKI